MNNEVGPKVRVPELKNFNWNRDVKELENFLWDMEQFFKAAHVLKGEKVSITSMYLTRNAKIWCCTQVWDVVESGRPVITTWATLSKELKELFLPTNATWFAREGLRFHTLIGYKTDNHDRTLVHVIGYPNIAYKTDRVSFCIASKCLEGSYEPLGANPT